MNPILLAGILTAGLLSFAVLGPWMLRSAAPALVRVPRFAIALLGGGVAIWLGTFLALGPVLAWVVSGPTWLPAQAAEVCQRCLAAANPFSDTLIDAAVPAVLLLAVPSATLVALAVGGTRIILQRMRQSGRTAQRMLAGASRRNVLGYQVHVIADSHPFALAFPTRHGGIALSVGALDNLENDELQAVLAHEEAHLRQYHHLIMTFATGGARYMRWVPLIAAAENALPHYLEIAADAQARLRTGTPALVSALVKLGERAVPTTESSHATGVLHAAGPERIRQLVRPVTGTAGALSVVAMSAILLVLSVVGAAVHLPYAFVVLTGCA